MRSPNATAPDPGLADPDPRDLARLRTAVSQSARVHRSGQESMDPALGDTDPARCPAILLTTGVGKPELENGREEGRELMEVATGWPCWVSPLATSTASQRAAAAVGEDGAARPDDRGPRVNCTDDAGGTTLFQFSFCPPQPCSIIIIIIRI